MRLFLGNLPFSATARELRDLFADYGATDVEIVGDRDTGHSRGFGFVVVEDQLAQPAIEKMNGVEFQGRALVVQAAKATARPAAWTGRLANTAK